MKKCPFRKVIIEEQKAKDVKFKYCIKEDCMAYDEEHDTCKLIENKKFQFIN